MRLTEADRVLAGRLMEREEAALREVIRLYGGVVHGMAHRVLNEASLAEEVAQDAFLALWRRPGAFDPERGSLKTFLVSLARYKAIDLVRKEESAKRAVGALMRDYDDEPAGTAGEVGLEQRSEVVDALLELPQPQRLAIVLAYFGGRTYREVASELRVPEGTIKTRMRDGFIKLRAILSDTTEDVEDE